MPYITARPKAIPETPAGVRQATATAVYTQTITVASGGDREGDDVRLSGAFDSARGEDTSLMVIVPLSRLERLVEVLRDLAMTAVLRDLVAPMEVGAVVGARDVRPMMEMTVHGLQS